MAYYRTVARVDAAAAPAPGRIGVLAVNLGTPDAPTYFAVQRYLREFLSDRRVINTSRWLWLAAVVRRDSAVSPAAHRPQVPQDLARRRLAAGGVFEAPDRQDRLGAASRMGRWCTHRARHDLRQSEHCLRPRMRWRGKAWTGCWCCRSTRNTVHRPQARSSIALTAPSSVGAGCRRPASSMTTTMMPATSTRWPRGSGRIGTRPANARIFCSPTTAFRRRTLPTAIPTKRNRRRPPGEWRRAWGWRRMRGPIATNRASGGWSGCNPIPKTPSQELAEHAVRRVSVVSPSFAVDCLETLEEVAIEYRDKFLSFGGERLTLVPALNDDDRHAQVLANIVKNHLQGWSRRERVDEISVCGIGRLVSPLMAVVGAGAASADAAAAPVTFEDLSGETLLENARVLVQMYIVQPGQATIRHLQCRPISCWCSSKAAS